MDRIHPHQLRALQWFAALPDELVAELAHEARSAEYREGDRIWNAGDHPTSFTFITRGLVQIVRSNARGDETTLGIFGPGEGIGNLAARDGIAYPAAAIAVSEEVVLLRVPSAVMTMMMRRFPPMLDGANRDLAGKTNALVAKIDVLCAGPVPARLALLFLHLAERYGDEAPEGGMFVPISLTRSALAHLVGTREETVIRVLSQWRQRGWVSTTPKGFELHQPEKLAEVVSSDGAAHGDV